MKRAIGRSIRVGLLAIGVWTLGQIIYIVVLCPPHHAWRRVQSGESEIVVDRGEGVARAGDAIFVCEMPHTTGPITWHLDLDCYCAPATITTARLFMDVGGTCAVDKPVPTREDAWGACRYARCSHHVDF
jgi:hypothetical protein